MSTVNSNFIWHRLLWLRHLSTIVSFQVNTQKLCSLFNIFHIFQSNLFQKMTNFYDWHHIKSYVWVCKIQLYKTFKPFQKLKFLKLNKLFAKPDVIHISNKFILVDLLKIIDVNKFIWTQIDQKIRLKIRDKRERAMW